MKHHAEQLARLLSANHPDMVLLDRLRDEYLLGSDTDTSDSDSDSGHVSDHDVLNNRPMIRIAIKTVSQSFSY